MKLKVKSLIIVTIISLSIFNSTSSFSDVGTKTYMAQMSIPHLPSAPNGGTDDYRCFLVDPKVQDNALITSVEFKPQQRQLVHHAILFRVGKEDLAAAIKIDSNGKGWPCFGGTGVGAGFSSFLTTPWLSSWAPGREKDVMPNGYATPINKNDRIVIQIHYNLLAATNGKIFADQSSVRIDTVPAKGSKLKTLYAELVAAPVELACPTGVTGELCNRGRSLADLATRTTPASAFEAAGLNLLCGRSAFHPIPSTTSVCDKTIAQSVTVLKVAPHMHMLGTSLKLILNPGTPRESVIFNRPKYNFDDQSATVLKKPITLKAGDIVRVVCTYNPKLRSLIPALKKLAPRYVTWGEGSADEMCLGVMGVARN